MYYVPLYALCELMYQLINIYLVCTRCPGNTIVANIDSHLCLHGACGEGGRAVNAVSTQLPTWKCDKKVCRLMKAS